ncbi:hypothetical protein DM860_007334 [Cuscuta australis]|uniref:HMA domain-containing protein n=1 Tax=Cuscuta australis TaxID=267555 RepID=A0A328E3G8_9ASTE|nr:hypothetical protein DM860_007334 [Cuscuta australis]
MSKMNNKQDIMKTQACVLRVNIHCDGCKHKVKKILLKAEGVYGVKIDADNGKVTVTGNADPATLLKKLEKSGKHAELWSQKGNTNNNNNNPFKMMNNQFMNLELGDFKGGKDPKSRGKGGDNKDQQKGGGHMMQNLMKGGGDMMMRGPPPNPKGQKTVKFDLPEDEFDDCDDSDEDEDEFYDDDEDDDDSADDELIEGGGRRHPPPPSSKSKTKNQKEGGVKGGGKGGGGGGSRGFSGMMNMLKGGVGNNGKSGGKAKKGDGVEIPMQFKGLTGGGNHNDVGGKNMIGGKNGKGGKNNGQFVGAAGPHGNKKGVGQNNGGDNWGHKGGGQLMMNNPQKGLFHEGGGGRGMGQMGPMGHYPMMGNPAAVQGLPAPPGPMKGGGGGYFPGMMGPGGGGGNPYYPHPQQQQYMAQMMMNQYQQQRPYGYDMPGGGTGAHPMMYAPHPHPHPAMGYGPPMHPPANDNFTHIFSDENTGSCSVM